MNSCNFTGRLTNDPDPKFTGGGTEVSNFCVAVDMGKDKQGEKQTEFVNMTAYGKVAETINKWMSKGSEIAVTGKFRTDRWEDKESGSKRSKCYIVVDYFNFIGSKPKTGSNENYKPPGTPQSPAKEYDEDDSQAIPF
ncbi:MAG: hypothetical protein DRQ46_00060 [Gammaproteobacteria bacterium]|nr:MAG: hypothetical protein DRQ46_00060 [Gammaproteobacteria bacterium]